MVVKGVQVSINIDGFPFSFSSVSILRYELVLVMLSISVRFFSLLLSSSTSMTSTSSSASLYRCFWSSSKFVVFDSFVLKSWLRLRGQYSRARAESVGPTNAWQLLLLESISKALHLKPRCSKIRSDFLQLSSYNSTSIFNFDIVISASLWLILWGTFWDCLCRPLRAPDPSILQNRDWYQL